jgi:ferric-dicitrate binding protein FerR (iron transport regulator)
MTSDAIALDARKLVFLRSGARAVTCERGTVWVTCETWERDILLKAGERSAVLTDRSLCVQALSAAMIRID